jgi:hypothetical protein
MDLVLPHPKKFKKLTNIITDHGLLQPKSFSVQQHSAPPTLKTYTAGSLSLTNLNPTTVAVFNFWRVL